jgi:hypothetical protein
MNGVDERTVGEEDVRLEHLGQVSARHHWLYLAGVLGGGLVLMILFIAALGAGSTGAG